MREEIGPGLYYPILYVGLALGLGLFNGILVGVDAGLTTAWIMGLLVGIPFMQAVTYRIYADVHGMTISQTPGTETIIPSDAQLIVDGPFWRQRRGRRRSGSWIHVSWTGRMTSGSVWVEYKQLGRRGADRFLDVLSRWPTPPETHLPALLERLGRPVEGNKLEWTS